MRRGRREGIFKRMVKDLGKEINVHCERGGFGKKKLGDGVVKGK